ncbi:MAG: sporulation transcriptional regulator SpoIIID [Firmicutes bacterium]|nr:sporulation transcriptional regulator SpoIIID [Bacillota bacterium]
MRIKPTPILNTIHKDVTERLSCINPELAKYVREVLDENKAERHIRGGQATKAKYNRGIIVN